MSTSLYDTVLGTITEDESVTVGGFVDRFAYTYAPLDKTACIISMSAPSLNPSNVPPIADIFSGYAAKSNLHLNLSLSDKVLNTWYNSINRVLTVLTLLPVTVAITLTPKSLLYNSDLSNNFIPGGNSPPGIFLFLNIYYLLTFIEIANCLDCSILYLIFYKSYQVFLGVNCTYHWNVEYVQFRNVDSNKFC